MKYVVLILFAIFIGILVLSVIVNILQRKRRKYQVEQFLKTLNEEQLKLINAYDLCYKVNFGDLWKKKK